jgi:hypothetical protein
MGLAAAGAAGGLYVQRAHLRRDTARRVADLLAASDDSGTGPASPPLEALPAPIHRYLRHVLPDERPPVRSVRLRQRGSFRTAPTAVWRPFTATQHVTLRPPGFVWTASVRMMPWVPVQVVDEFRAGRGALRATLGGVLTVADPPQSPALDEAELMRYLAEAPLYPTALLPGRGIEWTPIDYQSARATLTTHHTTASLVFHVNAQNEVSHVTGERASLTDEETTERRPWRGYWRRYALRNGLRVPLAGEVAWEHPDGTEASYWRGHVTQIDHFL